MYQLALCTALLPIFQQLVKKYLLSEYKYVEYGYNVILQ